ncbi:MAG: CoA-transferase [Actinomycetota bacterium]|nr:CoA-transferase [Actinomycetota bacterium]MDK1027481.1 CoA-transferase [Actinomycetota bacterium]MDK1039322.1 CoA-transferase [Actinomycetota bacterium]MDK1097730.1 CoA-transferase [Actinomycetota bacterium]MDK1104214.1 CoA-transferase [Actinomycetota bacterium]
MSISKIVSATDAVSVIRDGDVVASSGWGGHGVAEAVLAAIERRYVAENSPRDLTLVWAGGQGDGAERGLNHLGHEGLLHRTIGGHYGLVPRIERLAIDEKIEAYNLPEGILVHLFRNTASGGPGVLSTVGIGTFVDPRIEGGKVNTSATEDIVELTRRGNEDWLFYKGFPVDVAIIRGTTADPLGNITTEKEAISLEILDLALAARACGGYVICQVERVAEPGSLDSRDVRVPGILVDAVVVADAEQHTQSWDTSYNPAMSGELRIPIESLESLPLDARTIIARRAAMELGADDVVNVGLGLPELVGRVAGEEGIYDLVTFMIDTGVIGGVPLSGFDFGAAVNREALVDHASAFDFIDGGGLDAVFLGVGECDANGNVNVSRFGNRLAGCGGAINLTQRTHDVVFMTSFSSGGLEVSISDGTLEIITEGRFGKFVDSVGQITFSADLANAKGQNIAYITERCVFELGPDGLVLTEVAPGVDIDRDILDLLPFTPTVDSPRLMDPSIFASGRIGLRNRMLELNVRDRLTYDRSRNTVFLDFSGLHVRTPDDVREILEVVDEVLGPLTGRVKAIVNYDRFQLDEAAVQAYSDAVRYVQETYYLDGEVTRHTTNAFMRLKLGKEFAKRDIHSVIVESIHEESREIPLVDPP